jgi:hypothetical protein
MTRNVILTQISTNMALFEITIWRRRAGMEEEKIPKNIIKEKNR